MKTIMFNDRYGLTAAVLRGEKTQTRRNSCRYKVGEVLKLTDQKPIFGHKSGKRSNTHWICFMKGDIV